MTEAGCHEPTRCAGSFATARPAKTMKTRPDVDIEDRHDPTQNQRTENRRSARCRSCRFALAAPVAGTAKLAPATSSIARSARRPKPRGRRRQSGDHRDLEKALDASSAREPAVSSSANSAKSVSGSSSASRTLRETHANATSQAESQETVNPGTCLLPVFRDALAAPVAETARGAVLSETSDPPVPRLRNEQNTGEPAELAVRLTSQIGFVVHNMHSRSN